MWDPKKLPRAGIALIVGLLVLSFGFDMRQNPAHYEDRWAEDVARSYGTTLIGLSILCVAGYLYRLFASDETEEEEIERTPILIPDLPGGDPPLPRKVDQPLAPLAPAHRRIPHLVGITGGVPPRVEISVGEFTIGRSPDCDMVLSSQLVSRKHARIEWNGAVLKLSDLGSSNATQVNDEKVSGERILQDGDIIQIVDYQMEVSLSLPPSQDATLIRPKEPEA